MSIPTTIETLHPTTIELLQMILFRCGLPEDVIKKQTVFTLEVREIAGAPPITIKFEIEPGARPWGIRIVPRSGK